MTNIGFTTFIANQLAVYKTTKPERGIKIIKFQETLWDLILGLENQIPHKNQRTFVRKGKLLTQISKYNRNMY